MGLKAGYKQTEVGVIPDMTGFSPRNLKYKRTFAQAWLDRAIVQRTVAQLPWRELDLAEKTQRAG